MYSWVAEDFMPCNSVAYSQFSKFVCRAIASVIAAFACGSFIHIIFKKIGIKGRAFVRMRESEEKGIPCAS